MFVNKISIELSLCFFRSPSESGSSQLNSPVKSCDPAAPKIAPEDVQIVVSGVLNGR